MTKEEIQKNSEHWYNKYKELKKENRLLGERCNQLLKDKGELTDKVKELEDHLAEEVELHLHAEEYIKSLEKENEQLRNNGFTVSAMTEQQLKVAIEKGEQLEKKNAELKKELEKMTSVAEHQQDCNMKRYFKLEQAKEIIADLIDLGKIWLEESDDDYEFIQKAEQFIKEIEK